MYKISMANTMLLWIDPDNHGNSKVILGYHAIESSHLPKCNDSNG